MTKFNPTDYEMIEIDSYWTDEIYPLIRKDQLFADMCALAVGPEHGPVRQDIWERGPFMWSYATFWEDRLHRRFGKAARKGKKKAVKINKLIKRREINKPKLGIKI
jgi:hypothetical protein